MKPSIFISYRRGDAAGHAFAIWAHLQKEFGMQAVFFDQDLRHHLPHGCDWERELFDALDNAKACIVVIGPNWLVASDEQGTRRLDNEDDVVRREVQRALNRADEKKILLMPALCGSANMPSTHDLPSDLSRLAGCQARTYQMDGGTLATLEVLVDDLAAIHGVQRLVVSRELPLLENLLKNIGDSYGIKPEHQRLILDMAKYEVDQKLGKPKGQ